MLQATGGHGADLIVNTVGGTLFAQALRCAAFEGRLATVGYVDHTLTAEIDIQALHQAADAVRRLQQTAQRRPEGGRRAGLPGRPDLLPAIADGRIRPLVDRVFAFDQLPAAQACMEENRHLGKIVLQVAT